MGGISNGLLDGDDASNGARQPRYRHGRGYRGEAVRDRRHDARVAALWLLHAGSCAKLLRAHGRGGHADNFEAALDEVASIVAEEVGQDTLTEAMDWASGQLWAGAELATVQPGAKKRLH